MSATAVTCHNSDRVVDALVSPPPLQLPRPVGKETRARRARAPMNSTRAALPSTPAPDTGAACSPPYMVHGARRCLVPSLTPRRYLPFGSGARSNERLPRCGCASPTASASHYLWFHVR